MQWRDLWEQMCGMKTPRYTILVPYSVPPSVTSAWKARGYPLAVGKSAPMSAKRTKAVTTNKFLSTNIAFKATTYTGASLTGLTGLSALGSLATTAHPESGLITAGIFASLTALSAGITGRKYAKDPRRLSKSDKKAAQSARWITPSKLGYSRGFGGTTDSDEQRLFHLAVVIAMKIVTTTAWHHPLTENQATRVDLEHAVATMGVRLCDVYHLRHELEQLQSVQANEQINDYLANIGTAFNAVAEQVLRLYEYYQRLLAVEQQLLLLEHSERSQAIGDKVQSLLAETSGDVDPVSLGHLNMEAEAQAEAISRMINDLGSHASEIDRFSGDAGTAERHPGYYPKPHSE